MEQLAVISEPAPTNGLVERMLCLYSEGSTTIAGAMVQAACASDPWIGYQLLIVATTWPEDGFTAEQLSTLAGDPLITQDAAAAHIVEVHRQVQLIKGTAARRSWAGGEYARALLGESLEPPHSRLCRCLIAAAMVTAYGMTVHSGLPICDLDHDYVPGCVVANIHGAVKTLAGEVPPRRLAVVH